MTLEALKESARKPDADGCVRWYWRVTDTPLGVVAELWYSSGDKWRVADPGKRFEGEGKTEIEAVRRAIREAELSL